MWIPIAKPYIGDEEKRAVLKVLDSGQLSQGPCVAAFERAFADLHGVRHGVATSSGTTALIAALMAHGIGPGDEVIVPSFSFFATASSVLCVGATPVFADIDPVTFCLDPLAAERAITLRTKAILPVHLYGLAADMPRFVELCRSHELLLLEDAAQALGARIGERRVGSFGTAAFSFFPSKTITTLEGGMVLTDDAALADRLRKIRHQGMARRGVHEMVGYNFRMTEVAAAIGLVQLDRLPAWLEQRSRNAGYFDASLRSVVTPRVTLGYAHAYNQYTIRVPPWLRDPLVEALREQGVEARVYYACPIHRQPALEHLGHGPRSSLPETERAAAEVLSLPVHPALTDAERVHVANAVTSAVEAALASGPPQEQRSVAPSPPSG